MPSPQLKPDSAELIRSSPPAQVSFSRPKRAAPCFASEKPVAELKCCAPLGVALPRLTSRPTPA